MTKIQNPKLLGILLVLVIGYWNLRFICNLVLDILNLINFFSSNWQACCTERRTGIRQSFKSGNGKLIYLTYRY